MPCEAVADIDKWHTDCFELQCIRLRLIKLIPYSVLHSFRFNDNHRNHHRKYSLIIIQRVHEWIIVVSVSTETRRQCLSICLYVCLPVFLSLSVCLSVCVLLCLCVCLPVCVRAWLSVWLHVSACLSVTVCLCVCVCVSVVWFRACVCACVCRSVYVCLSLYLVWLLENNWNMRVRVNISSFFPNKNYKHSNYTLLSGIKLTSHSVRISSLENNWDMRVRANIVINNIHPSIYFLSVTALICTDTGRQSPEVGHWSI